MLPSEMGGSALGPRTLAAVIATLAEADASAAMVYLMHMSATATIAAARPGATVAQTLKDISAGKHLTTLAFSEAGSRSHFWAPVSRAKRNGAGFHLSAKKSWGRARATRKAMLSRRWLLKGRVQRIRPFTSAPVVRLDCLSPAHGTVLGCAPTLPRR